MLPPPMSTYLVRMVKNSICVNLFVTPLFMISALGVEPGVIYPPYLGMLSHVLNLGRYLVLGVVVNWRVHAVCKQEYLVDMGFNYGSRSARV